MNVMLRTEVLYGLKRTDERCLWAHQSNGGDDEIPFAFQTSRSFTHPLSLSPISTFSPPPPPLVLHHAAFPLQSLGAGLLPRALAVDVEAHVSLLVQVEELLEELGDVVVGLGRRLHEGALPLVGLGFPVLGFHLPVGLVALVAHEHDGNGINVAFDGQDLQERRDACCFDYMVTVQCRNRRFKPGPTCW